MLLKNIIRITIYLSVAVTADRWSRQISNADPVPDGTGDWVPLAQQQSDRSNNARVLNYNSDQLNKNTFNVDSQISTRLSVGQLFQPQGFKPQPKAFHQNREPGLLKQPPTSQSFFKFEMPYFGNTGSRQETLPTIQADYQIQHTLPQQSLATSPLFSQKPVFPSEFHPNYQSRYQPYTQHLPLQQNFVQDVHQQIKEKHVENKPPQDNEGLATYGAQSFFDGSKQPTFQAQVPYSQPQLAPPVAPEEVQLLYVPYDTLYPQRPAPLTYDTNRFNYVPQPVNPVQINNFYTPEPLTNPDPNAFKTSSTSTTPSSSTHGPMTTPQTFLHPHFAPQKPKEKPKAHQPPLAMFMKKNSNKHSSSIDVVNALASAKSISVLDSPTKSSPSIFVGPAGLPSPNGYTKFELPYLSTINRNNIEYLQDVPFFVAPLSYRAPTEFNKIVLPEPHVGSIVINKPLKALYESQILQENQQVIQPNNPNVRPMYITPNFDLSLKYQSTTPALRITSKPSKHRIQFGTAYNVAPNSNQYKNNVGTFQGQIKGHHNTNNFYQQEYIQEFNSQNTPKSLYGDFQKGHYSQGNSQIASNQPIKSTKEQNVHSVTSLRPTTIRTNNQFDYFKEHSNLNYGSSTSSKPEQNVYNKEQFIQEVSPPTSLRPTTSRPQIEETEYSFNQNKEIINGDTLEKPALIHTQREENKYYKTEFNHKDITSTSPKSTRTKGHKNRLQYNQENPVEISNAAGYTKDQLEQIQYLSNNFKQDIRPSTSRSPSTRTRTRTNNHRRPVEITTQSTYGQFKPMPNNVVNEEYFKVQPIKPTPSTLPPPVTTETINQEFYSETPGDIKTSYEPIQQPFNSQSASYNSNKDEEEYRMKTYFRQQQAFKNRPNLQSSTTQAPIFENVQYTPISFDYDKRQYNIQASTPVYNEESTLKQSKPKEIITFYAPTSQPQEDENIVKEVPISIGQQPVEYSHTVIQDLNTASVTDTTKNQVNTPSPQADLVKPEKKRPSHRYTIPKNHRPTYNNEVIYNHDEKDEKTQDNDQELEYEPNPYQLPSELPPLTPNLPGLVNALLEKDKENAIEKGTTEMESETTTTSTLRPTRRPLNRGRRPTVSKVSSSVSYSTSADTITRRPITRSRRPYNPRNNYNQTSTVTTTKSPTVRNPNRVRYNPTPEERRQYRPRTRLHSKKVNENEDNIEYQRDVLKQNYPVFKPSSKASTTSSTPTTTSATLDPATEAQEIVVAITPNNKKEQFSGLLEPLQIAQEYHQVPRQDNYGPGYFPNEEEVSPTEALIEKNEIQEIHPVFTTTTEAPKESTRKSLFIRRSRPIRTTTETPTTITSANEEKFTEKPTERHTVRPRVRPERPKIVKIRGRIRKPHPASTTTNSPSENSEKRNNGYQQLNKFNQDFYQDDYRSEGTQKGQNRLNSYNLETQESQWSPSLSNANAFKPLSLQERSKLLRQAEKFENEPDIVTANPNTDAEDSGTFSFNVSAGFGPSSYSSVVKTDSDSEKKVEKESGTSFSELLEEVMSGVENMYKNQNQESQEGSVTAAKLKQSRRKGVWKRVRVSSQPTDNLETSESQNLGTQIYNSIFSTNINQEYGSKINKDKEIENNVSITTPENTLDATDESLIPTTMDIKRADFETQSITEYPSSSEEITLQPDINLSISKTNAPIVDEINLGFFTTDKQTIDKGPDDITELPEYYADSLEMTTDSTTQQSENYNSDDLETQPSLFDEVKKQLSSLFSVNDNEQNDDPAMPGFQPRKQEYTSIQRIRAITESSENKARDSKTNPDLTTVSPFHKNLMDSVIYATSTSTEISHETEICYRGRCIKTAKRV